MITDILYILYIIVAFIVGYGIGRTRMLGEIVSMFYTPDGTPTNLNNEKKENG